MAVQAPETERPFGIDVMKAIAVFFVICTATRPFEGISSAAFHVINHLSRFAIPFLFIIGGYYLGACVKADAGMGCFRSLIWRMTGVYVFWSALYLLMPDFGLIGENGAAEGMLLSLRENFGRMGPADFLLRGSSGHLWVFPSLVTAGAIIYVFERFSSMRALMATAFLFYVLALLGTAYTWVLGEYRPQCDTALGPFMSLIYLVIGYCFKRYGLNVGTAYSLVLLAAGTCLHFMEWVGLTTIDGHDSVRFLMMTVPMAAGAFLVSLRWPFSGGLSSALSRMGMMGLGVYCMHPFFIGLMKAVAPGVPNYVLPFSVTALSLGAAWLLRGIGPLRRAGLV